LTQKGRRLSTFAVHAHVHRLTLGRVNLSSHLPFQTGQQLRRREGKKQCLCSSSVAYTCLHLPRLARYLPLYNWKLLFGPRRLRYGSATCALRDVHHDRRRLFAVCRCTIADAHLPPNSSPQLWAQRLRRLADSRLLASDSSQPRDQPVKRLPGAAQCSPPSHM
jgi:hypothetical protein